MSTAPRHPLLPPSGSADGLTLTHSDRPLRRALWCTACGWPLTCGSFSRVAEKPEVTTVTRRVSLPPGSPPLSTLMPPWLGHDGSYVLAELDVDAPRGPWAMIDLDSGRAGVGRRMPQIWGALLDGQGPALLGTSGGVIEVDLSGPSTVRELHQGVGHGRDGAETEFLRLDHRHVLAAALGQQRAKVIDLDRWAVVNSQVEITSPWVALGDTPTRIWSLPRGEVASLNASHEVTHRTTAPAALAAARSTRALYALVGELRPRRGTAWWHAIGRDLLPTGLQQYLDSPLDEVELCKLDPQTLEVKAARRLGSLAQVLEEAVATTLADDEEWSTGLLHRCLSTDAAGRPALVAGSRVVVLDDNTLRPVTDTRLPNTGSSTWASQNGQSRAVATSSDRIIHR